MVNEQQGATASPSGPSRLAFNVSRFPRVYPSTEPTTALISGPQASSAHQTRADQRRLRAASPDIDASPILDAVSKPRLGLLHAIRALSDAIMPPLHYSTTITAGDIAYGVWMIFMVLFSLFTAYRIFKMQARLQILFNQP